MDLKSRDIMSQNLISGGYLRNKVLFDAYAFYTIMLDKIG